VTKREESESASRVKLCLARKEMLRKDPTEWLAMVSAKVTPIISMRPPSFRDADLDLETISAVVGAIRRLSKTPTTATRKLGLVALRSA